ncbi:UNVERIFIED_CONTAM: hypothetical protein FKN15_010529 [Acipenser sinensis]
MGSVQLRYAGEEGTTMTGEEGLLQPVLGLWASCFSLYEDLLMETICRTAAFGFLRVSEFTVPSASSFPTAGIRLCDLSRISNSDFIIRLCTSKTDQLQRGGSVLTVWCMCGSAGRGQQPRKICLSVMEMTWNLHTI